MSEEKKNYVADQDKFKHKEYLRILKMLAGGYIWYSSATRIIKKQLTQGYVW